ncbi:MAG TPA: ABC transporter permease subunit [Methanomassiliicoccales archaeon]|nr:ABC transporter permease subunit [Methanomassiliicoccales archaeon]
MPRGRLLGWAALAFLFVAVLLPLLPVIIWSFSFRWPYPNLLPEWSSRAWDYVFSQSTMIDTMVTSIELSAVVTLLTLLIGYSTARALGTREFRGKSAVELFILLPAIIPVISAVMGMQGVFTRLGLSDTFPGVVIAHVVFALPYMVFGLASVFKNYNLEYEQQARTLGADRWNVFAHVTVPGILPGMVVSCLFVFVVSWSQYLSTIIVGGTAVRTLPMVLFALMGSGDYAVASAVAIIFILPVLILLALTSKFLAGSGVSSGVINEP